MSSIEFSSKLAGGVNPAAYEGALAPGSFGDPHAEWAALRHGCAVLPLPWRAKLLISGADRVRWLNGMVSNNTRDLPHDSGNYNLVLNPQGRIQGDLAIYNRGEHYLAATTLAQSARLSEFFDRHIIMDEVELGDISDRLASLAVFGPESAAILQRAGLLLSDAEPYRAHDVVWNGIGLTALTGLPMNAPRAEGAVPLDGFHPNEPELLGGPGCELWLHPEHAVQLWDSLLGAGAIPAGTQAWEWQRIALGVPRYGVDITDRDLPQETGRLDTLNFSKGCYVGQEIVERIRARGNLHRIFAGFRVAGAPSAAGSKLESAGKQVGEITSAAALPAGEDGATVALGYVRREVSAAGTELRIVSAENPNLSGTATVVPLPFQF